jgi:hypothetical protein
MVVISKARKLRFQRLIKSSVNRHNQILHYSGQEDRLIPYYWLVKFAHLLTIISYFIMEGHAMKLTP